MCRVSLVGVAVTHLCFALTACLMGQEQSRDTVVRWLRHQEQLIKTATIEYVENEEKRPDLTMRYVWMWSGGKEYCEAYKVGASVPAVSASDGEFFRTFDSVNGATKGLLSTPAGQHFYNSDRVTPLNLVYYFASDGLSNVFQGGARFEVEHNSNGGTVASIDATGHSNWRFTLVFDDKHRVVERRIVLPAKERNPKPWLYCRHQMTYGEPFKDRSGENIWFPRQVIREIHSHPSMKSGPPVIHYTYDIENVSFNDAIPDRKFVLSFPSGSDVFDESTGVRLGGNAGPVSTKGGSRNWMFWVLLTAFGLAGAFAVWVYVRRRC